MLKNRLKFIGSLFRQKKETSLQTKIIKVVSGKRTINLTVQVADTPKKETRA